MWREVRDWEKGYRFDGEAAVGKFFNGLIHIEGSHVPQRAPQRVARTRTVDGFVPWHRDIRPRQEPTLLGYQKADCHARRWRSLQRFLGAVQAP